MVTIGRDIGFTEATPPGRATPLSRRPIPHTVAHVQRCDGPDPLSSTARATRCGAAADVMLRGSPVAERSRPRGGPGRSSSAKAWGRRGCAGDGRRGRVWARCRAVVCAYPGTRGGTGWLARVLVEHGRVAEDDEAEGADGVPLRRTQAGSPKTLRAGPRPLCRPPCPPAAAGNLNYVLACRGQHFCPGPGRRRLSAWGEGDASVPRWSGLVGKLRISPSASGPRAGAGSGPLPRGAEPGDGDGRSSPGDDGGIGGPPWGGMGKDAAASQRRPGASDKTEFLVGRKAAAFLERLPSLIALQDC